MIREHFQEQLQALDEQVMTMGDMVVEAIKGCNQALATMDAGLAQALIEADNAVDRKRREIENDAFVVMATQQPTARDLRDVVAILIIVNELERIGDYCEGIAKLVLRMAAEPVKPLADIHAMAETVEGLVTGVMQVFLERDLEGAGRVWLQDDDVDELYNQVFRKQIFEMVSNPAYIRQGTYTTWIAHNFERMADRVTNIAERVAFVVTGDISGFREQLRASRPPL